MVLKMLTLFLPPNPLKEKNQAQEYYEYTIIIVEFILPGH